MVPVVPASSVKRWKGGRQAYRGYFPTGLQSPRYVWATGATREEARANLQRNVEDFMAGRKRPVGHRSPMGDLLERWLEEKRAAGIAEQTIRGYEKFHRLYWAPALGSVRADQLRAHHVQEMVNLARSRVGGKTIHDAVMALRQALRWLKAMGYIAQNPLADDPPLMMPRVVKPRIRRFTAEQFIEFLWRQGDNRWEPLWAFVGSTAISPPGEVAALRWTDLDGRMLTVQRTLRLTAEGYTIVPQMKDAHRFRRIELSDFALAALERQRALQGQQQAEAKVWGSGGYIFTTEIGTPIAPTTMRGAWYEALERAGLPRTAMKMYALRATGGRMIYRSTGKDADLAQAYMGHSKASDVTFRHYIGADEDDTHEAAVGVDLELGKLLTFGANRPENQTA